MERRAFIGTLAGGLLAAPLAAGAQPVGKVYRIGALTELTQTTPPWQGPFYDRMRELGWVYGRDFLTERRTFGDQIERIPAVAKMMKYMTRFEKNMPTVTSMPAYRSSRSVAPCRLAKVRRPMLIGRDDGRRFL